MSITIFFAVTLAAAPDVASVEPILEAISSEREGLSPEDVATRVLRSAPETEGARERRDAARAQLGAVRVGLAPRIEGSARVSRLFLEDSESSLPPSLSFEIPRDRASFSASLRYSLSNLFLETLPTISSAEARVKTRTLELEVARSDLALRAREAFWAVVRARGTLWVASSSLQEARASRDRLRTLVSSGLATPADLAAGAARYEARVEDQLAAEQRLEVARHELTLLAGGDLPPTLLVNRSALSPPPSPGEGVGELEREARDRRPVLAALDGIREQLSKSRLAASGARWPDLSISAEATYASPNQNIIPPEEKFLASAIIGLGLSWSPNDLAVANADRARLSAEEQRVHEQWRRQWRAIRLSIRQEQSALRTSLQRLEATAARVEAASEAFRTRRVSFENGRGLYTEVLSAEAELNRARRGYLFALIDAHLARARLDRAVGRLASAESPR